MEVGLILVRLDDEEVRQDDGGIVFGLSATVGIGIDLSMRRSEKILEGRDEPPSR